VIIELHLLQSFPVSNLNRDDTGQPKSAMFGGHPRGRISSQCLKRSARLLFQEYGLGTSETAVRTKRLVQAAAGIMVDRGRDAEQATAVAIAGLRALGFGVDDKTKLTQYLLFVGRRAGDLLAGYCERDWDRLSADASARLKASKKKGDAEEQPAEEKIVKTKPDRATLAEAQRILDARRAADVALFGRMIADNKDFNVDAASQVAHAISTHAVANEYDYYTAVDDLKDDDESGADMIGTVDFNAACYYRYANLDLDQLAHNLDGDTDLLLRTAEAWLYAFIHAVPSGKQNSMAARTMPDTLLAVVRDRGAWNLANAFLRPVSGTDLMNVSTTALMRHFEKLRGFYGDRDIRAVTVASVTGDLSDVRDEEIAPTLQEFVSQALALTKA
jgi:CRISPR system Cascade subunit CasC